MSRYHAVLTLVCLTLVLAPADHARQPEIRTTANEHAVATIDSVIQWVINQINMDTLIHTVNILSGEDSVTINDSTYLILSRNASHPHNDLAADYIFQTLSSYGLPTYNQQYSANGRNVYAVQAGADYPEKIFIICAHYDDLPFEPAPGADDDASGVAAVLETARILSQIQTPYTIIYALWDEEEIGKFGSAYYAQQAFLVGADILGVVDLEMLGWDGDNDGLINIHASNIANSAELADLVCTLENNYDLGLSPVVFNPGTAGSDHVYFWDRGYSAVLLIEAYSSGDRNPYYHGSNDKIAHFNLDYFHALSKLAIATIAHLAFYSTEPRLKITADSLRFVSELYKPDTLKFIIANRGLDSLHIESMQFSTDDFHLAESLQLPLILGKDQSHKLGIVFIPADNAMKTDSLVLVSNDPLQPLQKVILQGVAQRSATSKKIYAIAEVSNTSFLATLGAADSGKASLIGATGISSVCGLAAHPFSGYLYGIAREATFSTFVKIDAQTGLAQKMLAIPESDVRAMTFDGDTLWVASFGGKLFKIDLLTGETKLVGQTGISTLSGLAFNSITKKLCAASASDKKLYILNRNTAQQTWERACTFATHWIAFDARGQLFGLFTPGPDSNTKLALLDTAQVTTGANDRILSDTGYPRVLALAMRGDINVGVTEPRLKITADSLRFVSELYQPDTLKLIIANRGLDSLRIESMKFSTDDFHLAENLQLPLILGKDQSHELGIVFVPADNAMKTDSLVLASNDPLQPLQKVLLQGVAQRSAEPNTIYAIAEIANRSFLVTLDLADSGKASLIGATGVSSVYGLAPQPLSGYLHGIAREGNFSTFIKIDAQTGLAQKILAIPEADVRAITFDGDTLWAASIDGKLFRFNLQTGESKLVGQTGISTLSGLAFNSTTKKLWATSASDKKLYILNRNMTQPTWERACLFATHGITFDAGGQLFALFTPGSDSNTNLTLLDTAQAPTGTNDRIIGDTGYKRVLALAMRGDISVGVMESANTAIPLNYALYQNYPNPFNPNTTIEFALPKSAFVTLKIYNLLGEEVATLVAEKLLAGTHKCVWEASGMVSGVYLCRIEAGEFVQTKKLILLR